MFWPLTIDIVNHGVFFFISGKSVKSFCHIYAQWDQTKGFIADEAKHLLDLGLTCDTTFGFAQGEKNRGVLEEIRAAGGLCAPNIYPPDLNSEYRDPNWWKYPQDVCERLLETASKRFERLELGPLEAINTYTTGNGLVGACRQQGVKYILGFCAPTVIEDGDWEIAHYGSPLSPYFISDDDFRKPTAPNGEELVMMASMELRNPLVCLNHWSEGPWCPLNALAADRWLEPSGDPLPFLQIAEDWLRQSELSEQPLFFHINLQYFFADKCYDHNRRALEWLAMQRDRERLEIGSLQTWRQRMIAKGGFHRQTSYWRGEMMGFHVGHRPGRYPDVVVDENLRGQSVWEFPDPLPKRFYDYEREWSYPSFEPDGSAPASADFTNTSVVITEETSDPESRKLLVSLKNTTDSRRVRLLCWDALGNLMSPWTVKCETPGWESTIVPHPSGIGGAVLLEGELPGGSAEVWVEVSGRSGASQRATRFWGGLVAAETFERDGRPLTYLVAQTPQPFVVEVILRGVRFDREPVVAESLCGLDYRREQATSDTLTLKFDGTRLACWHRLWGVSADQVDLVGVEQVEERLRNVMQSVVEESGSGMLEVSKPGYQLFGNIRDQSRWDRCLARSAGEKELERMREWFAQKRPGIGETIIEVHPGIFLPRGSITKVLGHEFNEILCREGYGFREICADYPQGWDWGVAAWVQWRHLQVALRGLRAASSPYILHLHAIDVEGRDLSQEVLFFNPHAKRTPAFPSDLPIHHAPQICGVKDWVLPRGIDKRFSDEALCSVQIPDECLGWPEVGVWIRPLEKNRLYDWVGEKGAPGLLSHLWLTQ